MRIDYYDVAKGILIIGVVLGHTLLYVGNVGITHYGNDLFSIFYSFFVVFYMQAFFLINGLTTNFNVSYLEFLKKKFLTIMIPCFVFSVLINLYDKAYPDTIELLHILIKHGGRGTYMWFLPALFVANQFFWLFNRYIKKNLLKAGGILVLAVIGVVFNEFEIGKNIWYLYHALGLLPFTYIGYLMRKADLCGNKYVERIGILVYVTIMLTGIICNIDFPYICLGYNVTLSTLPLHLMLATCGSIAVLALSRKIGGVGLLRKMGKGSLVIYMTHIVVTNIILSISADFWKTVDSDFVGVLLFIIHLLVVIAISFGLNFVLNKKYVRIILGRV